MKILPKSHARTQSAFWKVQKNFSKGKHLRFTDFSQKTKFTRNIWKCRANMSLLFFLFSFLSFTFGSKGSSWLDRKRFLSSHPSSRCRAGAPLAVVSPKPADAPTANAALFSQRGAREGKKNSPLAFSARSPPRGFLPIPTASSLIKETFGSLVRGITSTSV